MTCRIYPSPYVCDPRPIYGALDALKLSRPVMYGWWGDRPPVRALGDGVKATLFVGGTMRSPTFVVAVANWRHATNSATLEFDWARMKELGGFTSSQGASLRAAPIRGFQPQGVLAPTSPPPYLPRPPPPYHPLPPPTPPLTPPHPTPPPRRLGHQREIVGADRDGGQGVGGERGLAHGTGARNPSELGECLRCFVNVNKTALAALSVAR